MLNTPCTPLVRPRESDNPHTKSYLRQIYHCWTPANTDEAKWFTEECLARAEELTSVLMDYANENTTPIELVRRAFAVLDDLLYMAYGMLEHWPDAQEDEPHA
jgi:hypothetical protein